MSEREGAFWDVMEGRKAPPPAATTLGFKLISIDPDKERFECSSMRSQTQLPSSLASSPMSAANY